MCAAANPAKQQRIFSQLPSEPATGLPIMLSILFVCTHNRCRSILFEAVANHLGQGKIMAKSAGSTPEDAVHPKAIEHLQKAGIDSSGLFSKSLPSLESFHADVIITVCDNARGEACPIIFRQTAKVHWPLTDPSSLPEAEQDAAFEQTLALMQARIKKLLLALENSASPIIDALENIGQTDEH